MEQLKQNPAAGFGFAMFILYIAIIVFFLFCYWKIYVKAGRQGWEGIIPFYNIYILMGIIGRPGWWMILYFIPFVNIFITIIVAMDLAKSFGKSSWFGVVWLWLLSIFGYPYLALSNAKYTGPSVKPTTTAKPDAVAPTSTPASTAPKAPETKTS